VNVSLYQKTTIKFFNKKDTTTLKIFNMKLQNLFIAAALLFATTAINAQDTNEDSHTVTIGIPNVALLDIESGSDNNGIRLAAIAPTEAGENLNFGTDVSRNSALWINYSSIVSGTETRQVTVAITEGVELLAGLKLTVTAATVSGGEGTRGTSTGEITLSTAEQDVITGIGSAYTGNGNTNGHNLTYQIAQSTTEGTYAALRSGLSQPITITYTLTDI